MKFNGFRSISEYENECMRLGFSTKRYPFFKDGENFFVLVTEPPTKTPTSVKSWHLFSVDEKLELMDGVINGDDSNYLGKLAAAGYFPMGI